MPPTGAPATKKHVPEGRDSGDVDRLPFGRHLAVREFRRVFAGVRVHSLRVTCVFAKGEERMTAVWAPRAAGQAFAPAPAIENGAHEPSGVK